MRCNSCKSHMVEVRSEMTGTARQVWYQCSVCGRVRVCASVEPVVRGSRLGVAGGERVVGLRMGSGRVVSYW